MGIFLVTEIQEFDTTSGHTPWHDESGRLFYSHFLTAASSEDDAVANVRTVVSRPSGAESWGLEARAVRSDHSDDVAKELTVPQRIRFIYERGNELRAYNRPTPVQRTLYFENGCWKAREGKGGSSEISSELDQMDFTIIRELLEETLEFLKEEPEESKLLHYNQRRLLDEHAVFVGTANRACRIYHAHASFAVLSPLSG